MNDLVKAAKQMHAMIDEAYGELLADGHRDGPRCLLLTNLEIALEAGRQAIAQAEADHIRDATKKVAEPVATLYRYVKDNMEPMTEWKACAEWPMIESRGLEIIPLYTAQPQREWIEPSDEQIAKINGFYSQASFETIAHAALALAKELNHG